VTANIILDHIVLNVRDIETMLTFYVDVIGLAPERVDAFRAGEVLFPSVRINDDTLIDLMPPAMWEHGDAAGPGRNLDHFCLNLPRDRWESVLARLKEGGRDVEAGPMTLWGAHGDATAVYLRDPESNRIELRYYA
jgi:catechol-2,3-dioxygenase